ncbi:hypothetical protein P4E94_17345 [Pontiellaceae bacterium B12219]|nr:hypothetical protein [Pontiellaceae bacterium B12219]
MKKTAWYRLLAAVFALTVCAEPVREGEWIRLLTIWVLQQDVFFEKKSGDVVNNSNVVGTSVDAIDKIDTHGHSGWMPEFRKTLDQLDGMTIYNDPRSNFPDVSEGLMREDVIERELENMRTYLDLFLHVPAEKYMLLNSFYPDYQFALAGFLIVTHNKSFVCLFPFETHSDLFICRGQMLVGGRCRGSSSAKV